ncbi:MAG: 16S rRNA (adenine(1518)-N(6)/adenine(1519)-N(6))-dimethyltransferase [Methylotenera sp. 24-45-7]|jgi:16S rRNA (adenine1518-N6/adenine1519-N6)-dimethyltransferase|nr:MAG: 16S rRNA (adenine(1518)-N(6)/adenine(1519)-N(6))-dimethyltransferase [Mehylophilales bacterium 35-46-6]OYZ41279.1 MAG: 16S rRNA (adenine(1518)-N(6)/adenine(1519)-N(6))-dimethyltransferase [Methylotenera sp. 24-45-7]OZA09904.1 MAG: 16S rRNA (adenine(1518)-N(6)/adenine(1519)-N(6))-dimethyltransferase [Methylotenera sp. 17-45-7]OZA54540.1 MAG: 16S rRNA (adenine(1518)-N(6)/adenine(1519)-N(6))-dimethyltransferase [Methylophilales bacterium 39-45-7]HQS37016.1 16S rRNA (adenine(1518)-N(6)/aden
MKHIAKKRFGQNFLTDQGVIDSLVSAISPKADDLMVEIGPGLGALTKPLLQKLDMLHVVEVDRDIIAWMQNEYAKNSITIHNSDALKFDFSALGEHIRVVGNLPYNISTPILFHLLDNVKVITDMHFMLQKEVVERMVADPSTAAYGRLSVMLQYRLQMEYLFTVPPEAFDPAPKVESAFVRCVPHASLPYIANDETLFAKVVTAAFGQRRKTLRNTLKGLLDDEGFSALNIDSQLRAENLSVADFVAIANHLSAS